MGTAAQVDPTAQGLKVPLPLLITGIAGVAGYQAWKHFRRLFPGQVVATRRRDNWRLRGPDVVGWNAEDEQGLQELFRRHRFAAVLYCGGNCALKDCELDPALAWKINYGGIKSLLCAVASQPVRVVFVSVDLVFSGNKGAPYVETDPPDPVTVYGKTMAAAEEALLSAREDACVLRISLPMGRSFNGHAGAVDWIRHRFDQHKPATLYFDEVRTPAYTDCLNRVFARALAGRESGIFHVPGGRALSLYQIGQVINRVGGYEPGLLKGIPRHLAPPVPPRAGDVRMDGTRLQKQLGITLLPWPQNPQFVPTDRQWHYRNRHLWQGSLALLDQLLYRPKSVHPVG